LLIDQSLSVPVKGFPEFFQFESGGGKLNWRTYLAGTALRSHEGALIAGAMARAAIAPAINAASAAINAASAAINAASAAINAASAAINAASAAINAASAAINAASAAIVAVAMAFSDSGRGAFDIPPAAARD